MLTMSPRTYRIAVWSMLIVGGSLVVWDRCWGGGDRHAFTLFDCGTFLLVVAAYCAIAARRVSSDRDGPGDRTDARDESPIH
jgi:hypothetical protein